MSHQGRLPLGGAALFVPPRRDARPQAPGPRQAGRPGASDRVFRPDGHASARCLAPILPIRLPKRLIRCRTLHISCTRAVNWSRPCSEVRTRRLTAAPSAAGAAALTAGRGGTTAKESSPHGRVRTQPQAHRGTHGEGREAAREGDAQVLRAVPARHQAHADGRRLHVSRARPVPRVLHARQGSAHLERRGPARSSTSTTATAAWSRATPTRSSSRPSRSAPRSAPSSACRPRTPSSWPSTSPAPSSSRSGAS